MMAIASKKSNQESGLTLMEVLVALMILSTCALPLLIALGDAQSQIARSKHRRTMKQLMEYKLSHILLDRPAEGEDPIYVEAAEGNFGEDFSNDPDKAYGFDESLYFFNYRIDSEEIDLGNSGGLTGEEDETAYEEDRNDDDAGGNPFGGGEEEEEDLSQLRYRVTLTIEYLPGNANFSQHMSIVTYVRHPHQSEAMSGPDAQGGPGGLPGGNGGPTGESQAGAGSSLTSGNTNTSGFTTTSSGSRVTFGNTGGGR